MKTRQVLIYLGYSIGLGLLLLALLEGLAGFFHFAGEIRSGRRDVAERRHTRYDELLGWVNVPGTRVRGMYTPGTTLTINSQGFRGKRDYYTPEVPPGMTRVICSGDSFTFGYGVSDGETWPACLEGLIPGMETVNMAQGGYGLGQMFLWYRRDGTCLDHQVHIVAIIGFDVTRMAMEDFAGYAKPRLTIQRGQLELNEYPVPRRILSPGYLRELGRAAGVLHLVALLRKARGSGGEPPPREMEDAETLEVLALSIRVFEELDAMNRAKGSTLVAVYLPTEYELVPNPMDGIRQELASELSRRGIRFVDLVEDIRSQQGDMRWMFIPEGVIRYPGSSGHYTPFGNRWVAAKLGMKLAEMGLIGPPGQ